MKKKWFIIWLLALAAIVAGGIVLHQMRQKRDPQADAIGRSTRPTWAYAQQTLQEDPTQEEMPEAPTETAAAPVDLEAVVATVGDRELTLGQLQSYYWAAAAQYRQNHPEDGPDYEADLDGQIREGSGESWQAYFLEEALRAWHTSQALIRQSLDDPVQTEETYRPNLENYEKYLENVPATRVLYGYSDRYQRNAMHQAYLDGLPQTLETLARTRGYSSAEEMARRAFGTELEDLKTYAEDHNKGYMYLTELSYDIELSQDQVEAYFTAHEGEFREAGITRDGGSYVDIRYMLLLPQAGEGMPEVRIGSDGKVSCTQEQWEACREDAEKLLASWRNKEHGTQAAFADMAHKTSQDTGTAPDGGGLFRIAKGQLIPELDSWCFESGRAEGDAAVIPTDYGCCILYYAGQTPIWYASAEDALRAQRQTERMTQARERYPMEVSRDAIRPARGEATVAAGDILYPDVAHERFTEVPLYLQQDYPGTTFGGSPIQISGCGITCLAMLSSYMTDQRLTPPVLCQRFNRYGSASGTDGTIFSKESQSMGFYMLRRTYDPAEALEALGQGHILISVQHAGYWTRAGHYILIEKLNEDGTVQVRDSNLFNYNNSYRPSQEGHVADRHSWTSVTRSTDGFWIFDHKLTRIPVCRRCGDMSQTNCHVLTGDYLCEKCRTALLRRENYLNNA